MEGWLLKIQDEYKRASQKFGKFNSTHEGYAVLKEEVDELWDNIKSNVSSELLEEEAVQVGAMALRFLVDCCGVEHAIQADAESRCVHCGAGDDIHHSYSCPTGLHPDRTA